MTNIEKGCYLYHLTALKNLNSIFSRGLLPRNELNDDFIDIADCDILNSRHSQELDNFVPFHFFAKNPFDGAVQKKRPEESFVLIAVERRFAQENNWTIIPQHPLSNEEPIKYSYQEGFKAINWTLMNTRDYQDSDSKSVCMAECLSPTIVEPNNFARLYVKSEELKTQVQELLKKHNLSIEISVNENMFIG